jgi:1-phosphatidylinositol phosphodiesterase
MSELKDETPLSALSIPGTHNSPTCYRALPSVRCQAVSPRIQLENGVRFFDVRVQPENLLNMNKDGLLLVHSAFPIALLGRYYFRELVEEVHNFLAENPSETLIMSVKREGTGNATDAQLSRILKDYYADDRWYTEPHIPTLHESRGKIVLMRRFYLDDSLKAEHGGAGWGINAETWTDNTPFDTCPSGDICVQDFYEVLEPESIEKKITYCEAHLERAGAVVCKLNNQTSSQAKQPIFLNFLSASNFWNVGCWPEKIAAILNPTILDYLCRRHDEPDNGKQIGDGATGIVVCDWAGNNGDWDLVRCIVGMNSKLEMREKGI